MKIFKTIGVYLAGCFFIWALYVNLLYNWLPAGINRFLYDNPILDLGLILIAGLIPLMVYLQICMKQFNKLFVYCFYGVYVLVLANALFNRSVHATRVIELNPLAFISYFGQGNGSLRNFLNIVAFIPFGILFHKVPLKKLIPLSIISILLIIEIPQYLFSVGIFDLSDVLLNFSGVYLGANVGLYFTQKGITMSDSLIPSFPTPVPDKGQATDI